MIKAIEGNNPAWRNTSLTADQIRLCAKRYQCPACLLARRRKEVFKNIKTDIDYDSNLSALNSANAQPGDIISMDPVGPIYPADSQGRKYFYAFKDIATGYDHVFCTFDISTKSACEAISPDYWEKAIRFLWQVKCQI